MVYTFFGDANDFENYLNKWFQFTMDEFRYPNLESIAKNLKAKKFNQSLYYIVSDFTEPSENRNENYGLFFSNQQVNPSCSI